MEPGALLHPSVSQHEAPPRAGDGEASGDCALRSPYQSILVAVDCSDHSNRAVAEAMAFARLAGATATITGVHVYAARLHDRRFRQMEGGLPERYRQQEMLEKQRDVHNELIARGLTLIADSYLDEAARACAQASIQFIARTAEGKNYRELVNASNSGQHDLLVIGAQGLGAVPGSALGSVCERVARRAAIDTLVIKDPARRLADGPIVVALDGSQAAYGGLITALTLARHWGVEVQAVAAYDPYFHYVAFNRISRVLSEEASRSFRFKDQERLHEEVIDAGLARIYESHLSVARSIAGEHGVAIETLLLAGKPHDAIEKHLRSVQPSLLVVGKLGIHADAGLDIGGNAERLLRDVDCAVLLSRRLHQPRTETVAEATTSWTTEAQRRMDRVPEFARGMARMAILLYAQQRGHTVITEQIVDEATASLCPGHVRPPARPAGGGEGPCTELADE
ncbi:MAG: universal stress protein [Burkholderiaceae bacterium]|nr:universal stress protein [Burkholderiaceae bacterium]